MRTGLACKPATQFPAEVPNQAPLPSASASTASSSSFSGAAATATTASRALTLSLLRETVDTDIAQRRFQRVWLDTAIRAIPALFAAGVTA